MYRDTLGFSMVPHMRRLMEINGVYAAIMRADKEDKDTTGLPSGIPIPVLPVDYLKEKPDNWIGGMGSYVCPVDSEWAIWFNWSMNNKNETAVLVSVKGMNPLTGQRVSGYKLENFDKKCPVHDIDFMEGLYCEKCGFRWPTENHICGPNPLYLDGYRTPDGHVRQFYFTEDMVKSIPEQVIGKEDTVPAFGFCIYNVKNRRTVYQEGKRYKNEIPTDNLLFNGELFVTGSLLDYKYGPTDSSLSIYNDSDRSVLYKSDCSTLKFSTDIEGPLRERHTSYGKLESPRIMRSYSKKTYSSSRSFSCTDVGVGAGSKIKQNFRQSNRKIEDWNEKPTGVFRLYFVFQEEFERYANAGLKDLSGSDEGYLTGLKIGG